MAFKDKFGLLLRVTDTKAKDLSSATGIPESTISLYKTGKRANPRSSKNLEAFSNCFAAHLRDANSRRALSELTAGELIITSQDDVVVASQVHAWLINETAYYPQKDIASILEQASPVSSVKTPEASPAAVQSGFQVLWGEEGKAAALRYLMGHLLSVTKPGTLYIDIDENADWLVNDTELFGDFMKTVSTLVERGFDVVQLLPPEGISHYYDLLISWIPLYLPGHVKPLYYPRMRDSVYRGVLIALEGEIAMMSLGVSFADAGYAFVSTDTPYIENSIKMLRALGHAYLPAFIAKSDEDGSARLYEVIQGGAFKESMSMRTALPLEFIPQSVLSYAKKRAKTDAARQLIDQFSMRLDESTVDSRKNSIVLAHVSSPSEVRSGKVAINIPGLSINESSMHTPETYAAHLQAVVDWLEGGEDRHFIPLNAVIAASESLIISRGQKALFLRYGKQFEYIEATNPAFVRVCEERILLQIERLGYDYTLGKANVIKRLKTFISQLK